MGGSSGQGLGQGRVSPTHLFRSHFLFRTRSFVFGLARLGGLTLFRSRFSLSDSLLCSVSLAFAVSLCFGLTLRGASSSTPRPPIFLGGGAGLAPILEITWTTSSRIGIKAGLAPTESAGTFAHAGKGGGAYGYNWPAFPVSGGSLSDHNTVMTHLWVQPPAVVFLSSLELFLMRPWVRRYRAPVAKPLLWTPVSVSQTRYQSIEMIAAKGEKAPRTSCKAPP